MWKFLCTIMSLKSYPCTPEVAAVTFPDSDSAPVAKFLKPDLGPDAEIFNFENPTLDQTSVTINPSETYLYCYLRNDHTDSYYYRQVTSVPVFQKFFTPCPGLEEKHRILPKSTPALWIHVHLCYTRNNCMDLRVSQKVL